MKPTHEILILIISFFSLFSCDGQRLKQDQVFNKLDTLKIVYGDTLFLVGKQLFPTKTDAIGKNNIDSLSVSLFFQSGNYYYVFYKKKLPDFLSYDYWNKLLPKYINFSFEDGVHPYYQDYIKVNYYSPYLTGFYNSNDSIIINGDWEIKELQNKHQLEVKYFSTSDTLLKLDKNIAVGADLANILPELNLPINFKPNESFELVLMEATFEITNVRYNRCFDCYLKDIPNAVVLSIKKHKLVRIQFNDSEFTEYLLKKKNISTKDVNYN